MNSPRALLTLLLMALPVAASAQLARFPEDDNLAQSAEPPQRMSVLVTFGDDPCPEAEGDEIVVCAQQPESERYRVPKELREELKEEDAPAGGGSWAAAVESYDDIARTTRPDSCSPVGSFGFTGCSAAALRQWHAEKRESGD